MENLILNKQQPAADIYADLWPSYVDLWPSLLELTSVDVTLTRLCFAISSSEFVKLSLELSPSQFKGRISMDDSFASLLSKSYLQY